MEDDHLLSAWIKRNTDQTAFAKSVACSESHLSLVLSGGRFPSYGLARRMFEQTRGEISVDTIFSESERMRAMNGAQRGSQRSSDAAPAVDAPIAARTEAAE